MKVKLLLGTLICAFLALGVATPGHASFAIGDLIRVVYDATTGIEEGTDLGNLQTIMASAGGSLGGSASGGALAVQISDFNSGGVTATWNQLQVGYWAESGVNVKTAWFGISTTVAGVNSGLGTFATVRNAVLNYYIAADPGGTGKAVASMGMGLGANNTGSYWSQMDKDGQSGSVGTFDGELPSTAGGEVAVNPNGAVTQNLLYWAGSTAAPLNQAGGVPSTPEGTLQTVVGANGLYTIYTPAATVPLPPSALLLLPGLFGLIGLRRKARS